MTIEYSYPSQYYLPFSISPLPHSYCSARRPPRNWRRNRSVRLLSADASLRSDAESQRTWRTPVKVFIRPLRPLFHPLSIHSCYTWLYNYHRKRTIRDCIGDETKRDHHSTYAYIQITLGRCWISSTSAFANWRIRSMIWSCLLRGRTSRYKIYKSIIFYFLFTAAATQCKKKISQPIENVLFYIFFSSSKFSIQLWISLFLTPFTLPVMSWIVLFATSFSIKTGTDFFWCCKMSVLFKKTPLLK